MTALSTAMAGSFLVPGEAKPSQVFTDLSQQDKNSIAVLKEVLTTKKKDELQWWSNRFGIQLTLIKDKHKISLTDWFIANTKFPYSENDGFTVMNQQKEISEKLKKRLELAIGEDGKNVMVEESVWKTEYDLWRPDINYKEKIYPITIFNRISVKNIHGHEILITHVDFNLLMSSGMPLYDEDLGGLRNAVFIPDDFKESENLIVFSLSDSINSIRCAKTSFINGDCMLYRGGMFINYFSIQEK